MASAGDAFQHTPWGVVSAAVPLIACSCRKLLACTAMQRGCALPCGAGCGATRVPWRAMTGTARMDLRGLHAELAVKVSLALLSSCERVRHAAFRIPR